MRCELQRMRWDERSHHGIECREQDCWKWWQEEEGDEMMEGSKGNMQGKSTSLEQTGSEQDLDYLLPLIKNFLCPVLLCSHVINVLKMFWSLILFQVVRSFQLLVQWRCTGWKVN